MPFIIAVAGSSGVGKDTLARILKSKIAKSTIRSLAFWLRVEVEETLRKFGYNVWTTNREEKEVFRNFLVEYAELARKQTNGQYFWKKLEQSLGHWCYDYAIISDVRFDEYENDEVWWVKKNGVLVYLEAYKDGVKIPPANYKEQQNEKKLFEKADYRLCWSHTGGSDEEVYSQNKQEIDKIIKSCSKNS